MGLDELTASITKKRANVELVLKEVSESESESERSRLAFFCVAMFGLYCSSQMLPTLLGAQQGDMIWGNPAQIMTRIHR